MNDKIRVSWNEWSDDYFKMNDIERKLTIIAQDPTRAFPRKVYSIIQNVFPDLKGKRVLVPSSGDNIAVFGFHLLGANVTSADISECQIFNAQRIASKNRWDIEFICEDSMELNKIGSGEYDLVYTSNGVHVWISDVQCMYRNFYRALKSGGKYIMFETHPFIRPFDDNQSEIIVIKPYEEIGPFGDVPNYLWRIQDMFNAAIDTGFTLRYMEELHPDIGDLDCWWYKTFDEGEADNQKKFDWKQNPWAALPQWISFYAQKRK